MKSKSKKYIDLSGVNKIDFNPNIKAVITKLVPGKYILDKNHKVPV